MFSSVIAAVTAAVLSVTVPITHTAPPANIPTATAWVDPDDIADVAAVYGSVGVRVLCSGDYTGAPDERAVLGDEDSPAVDHIFDVRDYYGIATGAVAC